MCICWTDDDDNELRGKSKIKMVGVGCAVANYYVLSFNAFKLSLSLLSFWSFESPLK